jgi:hypothetical protein
MATMHDIPRSEVASEVAMLIAGGCTKIECRQREDGTWSIEATTPPPSS